MTPQQANDLYEKLETLREENDYLRRELNLVRDGERMAAFKNRWRLTGKEATLLDALFARSGAVVTKQGLMDAMYGGMDEPECKIIDVFVCKLRNKIGRPAIGTSWGLGYFLTDQGVAACEEAIENPRPTYDPCERRRGRAEMPVAA